MTKIGLRSVLPLVVLLSVCCGARAQSADPAAARAASAKYDLSFAQHFSLDFDARLTKEDGQKVAQAVTALLQTAPGNLGTACNVEFSLQSEIGTFRQENISDTIRFQEDFEDAREYASQTPYTAFIVDRIQWCNGFIGGGRILGCSDQPGRLMLIVSPKSQSVAPGRGPILVAHELMHTSGSPHNPVTNYILYSDLSKSGPGRTARECSLLATNLGGRGLPPDAFLVAELPSAELEPRRQRLRAFVEQEPKLRALTQLEANDGAKGSSSEAASPPGVHRFVEAFWVHGVPYKLALRFSDADADALIKRLGTETDANVRANIVATLGAIGSKAAVDTLSGIVLSKRGEELSSLEYGTKGEAMIALAWAASKRPEASGLLIQGLRPEFWTQEWKWHRQGHSDEQVADSLAKDAAMALALVGTPAAQEALKAASDRAQQEVEGARVRVETKTRQLRQIEAQPPSEPSKDSARALNESIAGEKKAQVQSTKKRSFYETLMKEREKASGGLDNYYKN
jgi:hypothetical protein